MVTRFSGISACFLFLGFLVGNRVVAEKDLQAPRLLPHAVMSMLSPAISEHHRMQRSLQDTPAEEEAESTPALDQSSKQVPVKVHVEEKQVHVEEKSLHASVETDASKAKADEKESDDDELPMPSFTVDTPSLRGVVEPREEGVPPALDLAHPNFLLNSSSCLEVRKSALSGAGDGCFALCDIPNGTLLGEYKGKTFMTSGKVPNDGAYTWKVPACDDSLTVLTRQDVAAWATCGNRNGFVYVDAADLSDHKFNPLRYVNGAWSKEQRMGVNVDAVINDRRVYYFASKSVSKGAELVIDYGPQYWAQGTSPPPPSPPPPMLSTGSANSFAAANKFETEADDEAHSILEDADKLGARLRAAREKAKKEATAAKSDDIWADEREADQGLVASKQVPGNAAL